MKELYLCAVSMLTPLGADAAMVKASIDAGMSSYKECDIFGDGEPAITFSPVPDGALKMRIPALLPGLSVPQIRLLQLATFALADIQPQLPKIPLPLFLAGPEPYYQGSGISKIVMQHLVKATGVSLDVGNSRYTTGRAGVIDAIATAFKYFAASGAPYALVGGVDSFYDTRTLSILEDGNRLSSVNNIDGFVPGEGAAFLLLASPYAPEHVCKNSLLTLHPPEIVREAGHLLTNAPYTAEALAAAVAKASAHVDCLVNVMYTSENSEQHYTKEVTIARLRNRHKLSEQHKVYRPAECFGDVGAAFAAVAIGLASMDINTQNAPATLVCASSDGGFRGAICLSVNNR